jgi:hypothetical protein
MATSLSTSSIKLYFPPTSTKRTNLLSVPVCVVSEISIGAGSVVEEDDEEEEEEVVVVVVVLAFSSVICWCNLSIGRYDAQILPCGSRTMFLVIFPYFLPISYQKMQNLMVI